MTEAELRIPPSPRAVVDLIDSAGHHAVRERWGSFGSGTLSRLAAEGRRLAQKPAPAGRLHGRCQAISNLLSHAWDGTEHRSCSLPTHLAAAALGLSPRRLNGAA